MVVAQLSDMAPGSGFFGRGAGGGGGWAIKTNPIRTNNRGITFFIANSVFVKTLMFCSLIYLCVNSHHANFKE